MPKKIPSTAEPETVASGPLGIAPDAAIEASQDNAAFGESVECAVLYDSIYGKHDDIIALPRDQAEAARANGFVDTHPNAIKAIRDGI